MPRKRINPKAVLTNAEKQRRYRARYNAMKAAQVPAAETAPAAVAEAQDRAAIREQVKAELKASWEPELKAERMAAERKRGRELAKKADQTYTLARTIGICSAAAFFIGKDRIDITQALLSHFMIDRETARAALEADRRTNDLTFSMLDKSGAWA